MRIILLALSLSIAMSVSAQLTFGYPEDRDTILPSFGTLAENSVYEYLKTSPALPEGWTILSVSPVTIKMWSVHAGWDIISLDPAEGGARGFLYDFSWNATELPDSTIESRLVEILVHKEKSPR